MKSVILVLTCLAVGSGCTANLTWQAVTEKDRDLAAKVEYMFLQTAWDSYLIGWAQGGDPQQDYRKEVASQFGAMQRRDVSNANAYWLFKDKSKSLPDKRKVFEDAEQAAKTIDASFLKAFGRRTHLEIYKRDAFLPREPAKSEPSSSPPSAP